MNQAFIEKRVISTELPNVNREKHKLKSHRVCRRNRESIRIQTRSFKSLGRKVREFVYARILSCIPMSSTLHCYVNAKKCYIFIGKRSLTSPMDQNNIVRMISF